MWADLESLFRDLADLGDADRRAYYDARQIPADLRAEVESLLAFDGAGDERIEASIAAAAEQALAPETPLDAGSRCGPYVLDRLLGHGGMGSVFLAHRADGEVEQRVAIKLVRDIAGLPALRERFLNERQIQASLSHPGIARLLDAGHTVNGQPYLAMEYIEGQPIDRYCANLDPRQKIEIFLKVCDALSYAHRNLIIHRDLKPSNILVDCFGQPKLLDFGMARAVGDSTDAGLTRERILTPEYASPEQVAGAARTTATDVYSLGAVLYQLLTGSSPHTSRAGKLEPIEVLIASVDPCVPSSIQPALSRDLDFVLAKALRKEPEERYASADAFADDLRAFLESRPVTARRGSAWYRTRKFLRRQWLPSLAVALALIGLFAGLYAANRARNIAQKRFHDLRQLARQVVGFDADIRGLPGSTRARQKIVSAALQYLDGLGAEAQNDPSLGTEVASGYLNLGKVQGVPVVSNLGQVDAAEASLRKADRLIQGVLKSTPYDAEALHVAAEIAQARMILSDSAHRGSEAVSYAHACASDVDALVRTGRASRDQLRSAAAHYLNVGLLFLNQHQLDEAMLYTRRGVELERFEQAPTMTLAIGLSLLANVRRQAGDLAGALDAITESRNLADRLYEPAETQRALDLYTICWRQGQILGSDEGVSLGREAEAIEPLETAYRLMEQAASKDPNDSTSRDRLSNAALQLGDILRHRDPARALAVFDQAIARQRELPGNRLARRQEERLLARSSYALRQLQRDAEARERINTALKLLQASKEYPAKIAELGEPLELVLRAKADHQAETGNLEQAIQTYRGLLDLVAASKPHPLEDLRQANDLSRIYLRLARCYREAKQPGEAARFSRMRADLWAAWDRKLPSNPFIARQRAEQ